MDLSIINNRKFDIYDLGFYIRGSINQEFTYRVRPGNGYFGSIEGEVYQDKYAYYIPSSINNPEAQPYRNQFKAAVRYWQKTLSFNEQVEYNERAAIIGGMSGFNLFMREAMKGLVHMFVNRPNIAGNDFTKFTLTIDNAYHDLDLSGIITEQATAILLRVDVEQTQAGREITFTPKSGAGYGNSSTVRTLVAGATQKEFKIIAITQDRKIRYVATTLGTWNILNLIVQGWWT